MIPFRIGARKYMPKYLTKLPKNEDTTNNADTKAKAYMGPFSSLKTPTI